MVKKLRKALFRPMDFLKDSWLFKYDSLEDSKKTKNLFVISHLGQLAQIEAVIKKEKLLNSILVILYTNKNKKMPALVRNSANRSLFNRVLLLQLPSYPNKINIKNLMRINNTYQKMIRDISPHRLFILSFEKHYCLLANFAAKKGIEVNLVEEGTATYKYDSYDQANSIIRNTFTKEEKRSAILIKSLPMFKELRPALGIYKDFHTIYACHPQALKQVFESSKYKEFFLYENIAINDDTVRIKEEYKISKNDIIYLNQRYPFPQDIYATTLISILSWHLKMNGQSKIFIKLHPKDSEELKSALRDEIIREKLVNNIILIDKYNFLVEGLIHISQPKEVIALTSTGLIYANKISPHTTSISIYPLLKEMLLKNVENIDKYFKESNDHFEILTKFDNITFLTKMD